MTDREIREKLREYKDIVFHMDHRDAQMIDKEIDQFCIDNNVNDEQLREFTASGAGEILYMLTH